MAAKVKRQCYVLKGATMPHEPNLPSREEVEDSGAADWVDQALHHHQKKQEKLARTFGGETAALRREKDALAQAFAKVDEDESERGPDLFAKERSQGASSRQSLSQMFGEEKKSKQKEDDALRGLFGAAPKSNSSNKKKR